MAPDCVRCAYRRPRKGTEVRTLGVGGRDYTLRLCRDHASLLDRELLSWTRLAEEPDPAEEVEAPPALPLHAGTEEIRAIQQRAWQRARHARQAQEADQQAQEASTREVEARVQATLFRQRRHLDDLAGSWNLIANARLRASERGFTEADVLEAVVNPEATYPDIPRAGRWIHRRGQCCAVVRREDSTVISVLTFGERIEDDEVLMIT